MFNPLFNSKISAFYHSKNSHRIFQISTKNPSYRSRNNSSFDICWFRTILCLTINIISEGCVDAYGTYACESMTTSCDTPWMIQHCQAKCNSCDWADKEHVCSDEETPEKCHDWEKAGLCDHDTVKFYCPYTCRLCQWTNKQSSRTWLSNVLFYCCTMFLLAPVTQTI